MDRIKHLRAKGLGMRERGSSGRGSTGNRGIGALPAIAAVGMLAAGASGTFVSQSGGSTRPALHARAARAKAPWVIGAITDLTGPGASEGQAAKIGANYYFNQLNARGGINGRKVQLRFCDDGTTATGGSQCAVQLAGVNSHVVLLLGSLPPAQGAITQLGHNLGISILPDLFPKASSNVFQDNSLETVEMGPMMKSIRAAHLKTIGVVYVSNSSGAALLGAAKVAASSYGLQVIAQPMDPTATDVTPQLVQLRSQGAQVLFAATIGQVTDVVLSSYHTLGLTMPIILNAADVGDAFLSSLSFPIPPRLYGITNMALGKGFPAPIEKAWSSLAQSFKRSTGTPIDSEATGDIYAGCLAARVLSRTNGASGAAEVRYLATHEISCLGARIRFSIPGLHVPTGVPQELVQAGPSASDGWGPVRTKL